MSFVSLVFFIVVVPFRGLIGIYVTVLLRALVDDSQRHERSSALDSCYIATGCFTPNS